MTRHPPQSMRPTPCGAAPPTPTTPPPGGGGAGAPPPPRGGGPPPSSPPPRGGPPPRRQAVQPRDGGPSCGRVAHREARAPHAVERVQGTGHRGRRRDEDRRPRPLRPVRAFR